MASGSNYIPRPDLGFALWLQNFVTVANLIAAAVGIDAAEV